MSSDMPDWYTIDIPKEPKCFEIKMWMIEVIFVLCVIAVWLMVYVLAIFLIGDMNDVYRILQSMVK